MRSVFLLTVAVCLVAVPARAQHEQHEGHESPYAGMEGSEIPALTAQELEDLRTGAGMGFAKAAELNHYPGPRHVLEMGQALGLTEEQQIEIEGIHAEMKAQAIELGEAIIDAERTLGGRFEHGHIDDEALASATMEIAILHGRLRHTHLRAHLATRDVLEASQVAAYDRLRGYGDSP